VHEFIIFTIGGLAAAGIYAITASGLTLTYTTTGIFNWAHGAIGMVCAFAYWQMSIGWGWPTLVSMLVCLFVVAPVIGIVIEAGVMRRLEGVSEASKLVVTLAVALMLLGVAQWIWNPTTYRALPPLFNNDTLVLGSIRISYNDVTVLILALVVAVGLRLFLYRTRMGVTMRASVDDRTLTSLNGSSAIANARNAWIVGSMLAALAGILIAPTLTLSASALTLLIVNAYAASVIGRLRSIPMTFVGAIILGLSIAYSVAYLPQNPYIQGFENAVPAIILFIALLVLPQSRLRGHRQLRSRELAFRPTWNGTGLFCAGTIVAAVFLATTVSTSDLFSLNRMWGLAIVGLSIIPIVGYAGRLSLCQLTFAGIGASVVGHLGAQGNPLSLLAAAAVAAAISASSFGMSPYLSREADSKSASRSARSAWPSSSSSCCLSSPTLFRLDFSRSQRATSAVSCSCRSARSARSRSSRSLLAGSASLASAISCIFIRSTDRCSSSISTGRESISIRSRDAASSIRSMALSGRNRAVM